MMMISAPARSIMDHYDVHFRGSLVALICRRCKYLLVVPAATPAPALSPLVLMRLHDLEEVMHRGGSARAAGPDPAGQGAAPGADAGAGGGQGPGARRRTAAPLPGLHDRGSGDRSTR